MDLWILIWTGIMAGIGVGLFFILGRKNSASTTPTDTSDKTNIVTEQPNAPSTTKSSSKKGSKKGKEASSESTHRLQCGILKGFNEEVNFAIFDPAFKYLVVGSQDRIIRLYHKDHMFDKDPRFSRIPLPFDHATAATFLDETKLVISLYNSRELITYQITTSPEGKLQSKELIKFQTDHKDTIKAICPSYSKLLITCSEETISRIYNLQGKSLGTLDTNQVRNHMAAITPDGNLYSVAAWTGDVKVWNVQFNKSGEFEKAPKVMDLVGHRSTVYYVTFSVDSSLAATISKDGTWKLWNVNVRYHAGEDPKSLATVKLPPTKQPYNLIGISPNKKVIVVANTTELILYTPDGTIIEHIQNASVVPILSFSFSPDSRLLALATQKYVTLWNIA